MILVDTSVWISHFRRSDRHLSELLRNGLVFCHLLVIGELACGNLKNRADILALVRALPQGAIAESAEILAFIENELLMGTGIGIVDVYLLASCRLSRTRLWTADKNLKRAAARLGLDYRPPPT